MGKSTHAARVSQRHSGAAAGDRLPAAKANTGAAQTRGRKPNSRLVREMRALGPWFHNLHLPDGTQTAPDHFLGGDFPTFKWLEIAPDRVAVIGDDPRVEIEMARGGGALGIGVTTGATSREQWAAQDEIRRPHHVIDSLAEFLPLGLL